MLEDDKCMLTNYVDGTNIVNASDTMELTRHSERERERTNAKNGLKKNN